MYHTDTIGGTNSNVNRVAECVTDSSDILHNFACRCVPWRVGAYTAPGGVCLFVSTNGDVFARAQSSTCSRSEKTKVKP